MTDRLEVNWDLDGYVNEQRYYCSLTTMDTNSMPAPKAILAGDVRTYTDTEIEAEKKYYVRVGSVKSGIEKISSEFEISTVRNDPYWSNVLCLLRFDGNLTDEKGHIWTGSNVVYEGGKFGSAFRANGTAARLATSPNTAVFNLSGLSCTLEFWINIVAMNADYGGILTQRYDNSNMIFNIITAPNTSNIVLEIANSDGSRSSITIPSIGVGTYKHIAFEVDTEMQEIRGFLDGILVVQAEYPKVMRNSQRAMRVGTLNQSTNNFRPNALIDEVRVTKGICRYVTDFNVPTVQFPNF